MDHKLFTTRCAVPYCDSGKGTKRHMFPSNSALGSLWVQAVHHPVLSTLPYLEIRAKRYWICFKHFAPESIHYAGRKQLGVDAVPTLLLPSKDDCNIVEAQDLPIEAAAIGATEINLEITVPCNSFSSLHYSRSPIAGGIRKSSLKTPDASPVKAQFSVATKRQLFTASENDNLSPSKKFKPSSIDPHGISKDSSMIQTPSVVESASFEMSAGSLISASLETSKDLIFSESINTASTLTVLDCVDKIPHTSTSSDSSDTNLCYLRTGYVNVSENSSVFECSDSILSAASVNSSDNSSVFEFSDSILSAGSVSTSDTSSTLHCSDSILPAGSVNTSDNSSVLECSDSILSAGSVNISDNSSVLESSGNTSVDSPDSNHCTSTVFKSVTGRKHVGKCLKNFSTFKKCLNATSSPSSIPREAKIVMKSRIRRRRILGSNDLEEIGVTPKGKRVITESLRLQKELSKYKKQLRRRRTRNELRNKCFLACKNFKHLSSTQKAIVQMQLQNAMKSAKGRRFSEEDKNLALAIYKRSPSAYRFLTQVLILPSVSTVKRNLGKIDLDTGINSNISQLLKECASSITDDKDKAVILIWDETHLKTEVHYDHKKDKIIGFEDFGNRRTSKFANEILVFMIRGLWSNTKLPISYYFSNSQTTYADLVHIIEENLTMLKDAGFHVVATICDGASSNVKAYEHLRTNYIIDCRRKKIEPDPHEAVIELNGIRICLLHDAIHMFKCERNLMLKYLVELGFKEADLDKSIARKFAKWEHYETAFDMDINSGICDRHIPKITEVHIRKHKIKKMKVSHCCQVFSRSMAKWLQTCILIKDVTTTEGTFSMDKEAVHTAEFTLFQDQLFDTLNARKSKVGATEIKKPLQQVVTDESPHWEFWTSAIKKFENMRFRTKTNVNPPKANDTRLRFIRQLKTMPDLWKILKEKGFPYLKTGYVNQDPLENFFGRLKAYGVRNVSPSSSQAEAQLKALLVSDLSGKNSIGANCLDDEGTILATLGILETENSNTERSGNRTHELDEVAHPTTRKNSKLSPLVTAKRILSAGHFAKIVLLNIKDINGCKDCFEAFLSEKENDTSNILKAAHIESAAVIANADYFERGFSRGVQILEKALPSIGFKANLRQSLKEALNPLDFEWIKCNEHRHLIQNSFKANLILHCINNWTIHLNQILSGQKKINKGSNLVETEARRQYLSGLKRINGMDKQRNPLAPELIRTSETSKPPSEVSQSTKKNKSLPAKGVTSNPPVDVSEPKKTNKSQPAKGVTSNPPVEVTVPTKKIKPLPPKGLKLKRK